LDVRNLTKRYGRTVAVDGLSFRAEPGRVTGFLGPNGAGKSTTMRVVLGLDAPSSGTALVNGRSYASLRRPMWEVGALLDPGAVHPGRTARDHLRWLARSNRIPRHRVSAVLDATGLSEVAGRKVGGFSLGMRQRLGIAAMLLGDPAVLLLDEPVNGLDPEGVRWIRDMLRGYAAEGRTILLSSHLMSEMELTADHLVIIGRGRLIADTPLRDLGSRFQQAVFVRTPRTADLRAALEAAGATVSAEPSGGMLVKGRSAAEIGDLALARGVAVHEMTPRGVSLEDAYLELTRESVDYRAGAR
jgi:ABC-2 type transport system ATP-binding protein